MRRNDAYVRKIKAERTKVQGSFRSLINRLETKGLIAKDQVANLNAGVRIRVFDHRKVQAPLPEIEGVEVTKVKKPKAPADNGQKKQGQKPDGGK